MFATHETGQLTGVDFVLKIAGLGSLAVYLVVFLAIKVWKRGPEYLVGAQEAEASRVRAGEITVSDLQNGPWRVNAAAVSTFGIFSLGSLIASVTYMFTQELVDYDLLIFQILLFIFAISVLNYFVSLQYWFLSLDLGQGIDEALSHRRRATTFQTLGWFALIASATLAILVVSTILGWVFALFAAASLLFVYEYKNRLLSSQLAVRDAHADV